MTLNELLLKEPEPLQNQGVVGSVQMHLASAIIQLSVLSTPSALAIGTAPCCATLSV